MLRFATYILFLTACYITGCKKKCESTALNNLQVKMYITPNVPKIKLGDTLKLTLKIYYKSYNRDNGKEVDVSSSSLSTSGIDLTTMFRVNDSIVIDGNNFRIIPVKGSYTNYNNVTIRASYVRSNDAFEFEAYIIPIQKGLVRFANYKAEGWMNGKCILNVFAPMVGSVQNNHDLFYTFVNNPNFVTFENSYYVWVE